MRAGKKRAPKSTAGGARGAGAALNFWVTLDLERRVNAGREEESTEEYGVRIAASVARHYVVNNRPVGLMTFGRDLRVLEPERGQQQLTRILETVAIAYPV